VETNQSDAGEFGMTPASRSKVGAKARQKPTHWKNFLKAQMMNGNRCRWIPLRRARGIWRYYCLANWCALRASGSLMI
jgi:hypothetical protein